MASYEHTPLNSVRNAQLLKLNPSEKSIIECELVQVYLDFAPQYGALSYTRGGTPDSHIICNGKQLLVMKNCAAGIQPWWPLLQGLVGEERIFMDRCHLHQPKNNNLERIMGEIYEKLAGLGMAGSRNSEDEALLQVRGWNV